MMLLASTVWVTLFKVNGKPFTPERKSRMADSRIGSVAIFAGTPDCLAKLSIAFRSTNNRKIEPATINMPASGGFSRSGAIR